jgi:hypothetical protein
MFDGTTLTGWTASASGEYVVANSATHATGKARGWIYYAFVRYRKQVSNSYFRLARAV